MPNTTEQGRIQKLGDSSLIITDAGEYLVTAKLAASVQQIQNTDESSNIGVSVVADVDGTDTQLCTRNLHMDDASQLNGLIVNSSFTVPNAGGELKIAVSVDRTGVIRGGVRFSVFQFNDVNITRIE